MNPNVRAGRHLVLERLGARHGELVELFPHRRGVAQAVRYREGLRRFDDEELVPAAGLVVPVDDQLLARLVLVLDPHLLEPLAELDEPIRRGPGSRRGP